MLSYDTFNKINKLTKIIEQAETEEGLSDKHMEDNKTINSGSELTEYYEGENRYIRLNKYKS